LAALKKRGLKVAPFKIGPDFIDPGHHYTITSTPSYNLDGWMLPKAYNVERFQQSTAGMDMAVVEGVMGLFDGYDGKTEAGSTAQMAKWLKLPVLLVVDAKSMARSAAALVQGFERFDSELQFAGVLFNNLGSPRHLKYLQDALENQVQMPCLGGIIHQQDIGIPERHLGLVTRDDYLLSGQQIDQLANIIEQNIDLNNLLTQLPPTRKSPQPTASLKSKSVLSPPPRIGVASDRAFCFYYPDNLELLSSAGAELVYFSPIEDPALPPRLSGLYFGGGYPELFAQQLTQNQQMRQQIRAAVEQGMPVYSECGGFMYLCEAIKDLEENRHSMVGVFPFTTQMFPRLKALGYREVFLSQDTSIGVGQQRMRGHEFHYSEISATRADGDVREIYTVTARSGQPAAVQGFMKHNCIGSYIHLHFGSEPLIANNFVDTCRAYQRKGTE
jgi:cobyrinic acid a,c-diamide synthase